MRQQPTWSLIDTVLGNLEERIGGHPDLAALRVACHLKRRDRSLLDINCDWPPMIKQGYDAELDNPYALVISQDLITIGALLSVFTLLCACHDWFRWYW